MRSLDSLDLRQNVVYGALSTVDTHVTECIVFVDDDDDELMLNVLRCHLTY